MNFESMWSVQKNSDLFFWQLSLPLMAVVIPLFLWRDFERMFYYINKKILFKRAGVKVRGKIL